VFVNVITLNLDLRFHTPRSNNCLLQPSNWKLNTDFVAVFTTWPSR